MTDGRDPVTPEMRRRVITRDRRECMAPILDPGFCGGEPGACDEESTGGAAKLPAIGLLTATRSSVRPPSSLVRQSHTATASACTAASVAAAMRPANPASPSGPEGTAVSIASRSVKDMGRAYV